MNDEEKRAIEYLKQNNIVEIQYDNYGLESIHRVGIDEKQIILNLIEKQQKEIEELKDKYSDKKIRNTVIKRYREVIEKDYVSKDKIKAKIEELKKYRDIFFENNMLKDVIIKQNQIQVLQSLLEKEGNK